MRWTAGIATIAVLAGLRGLWPGDPVAADALTADRLASTPDLADPAWLDPARELGRLRPWQPGFGRARRCLAAFSEARRERHHHAESGPIPTDACR